MSRKHFDNLITDPPKLEIDSEIDFNSDQIYFVPKKPGIYLVYDIRGVLYIGKTNDLRRRCNEHYHGHNNRLLSLAIASPVGNLVFAWRQLHVSAQSEVEKNLIRDFNPPCNSIKYRN